MNRNVIITGVNRGIGRAIMEAFVLNGDNVWACCRHANEDLLVWIKDNTKGDQWVRMLEFDLSDEKGIDDAFRSIIKDRATVDILVNVAGIGHLALFQMTDFETIRKIYEVNLFGLMKMCQLAIRPMTRQKYGHIINISSTAAHETYVGNSIYGASKAAVVAFTQSLAAEVAPLGIRVNTIAPGLTDTDMSVVFEGENPDLPLERSALGRKLKPSEVADVVLGLTSEKMKMINGQMICVNGGSK